MRLRGLWRGERSRVGRRRFVRHFSSFLKGFFPAYPSQRRYGNPRIVATAAIVDSTVPP